MNNAKLKTFLLLATLISAENLYAMEQDSTRNARLHKSPSWKDDPRAYDYEEAVKASLQSNAKEKDFYWGTGQSIHSSNRGEKPYNSDESRSSSQAKDTKADLEKRKLEAKNRKLDIKNKELDAREKAAETKNFNATVDELTSYANAIGTIPVVAENVKYGGGYIANGISYLIWRK